MKVTKEVKILVEVNGYIAIVQKEQFKTWSCQWPMEGFFCNENLAEFCAV